MIRSNISIYIWDLHVPTLNNAESGMLPWTLFCSMELIHIYVHLTCTHPLWQAPFTPLYWGRVLTDLYTAPIYTESTNGLPSNSLHVLRGYFHAMVGEGLACAKHCRVTFFPTWIVTLTLGVEIVGFIQTPSSVSCKSCPALETGPWHTRYEFTSMKGGPTDLTNWASPLNRQSHNQGLLCSDNTMLERNSAPQPSCCRFW